MRVREFSQADRERLRADARDRQKKRRIAAGNAGRCIICCVNPRTEGLAPGLKPYRTCDRCRTKTPAARANQIERDKHRKRVYSVDPVTGRAVQRYVATSKQPATVPDRFCVECQASGFHRADCPTLQPKKKREPMPRPAPTLVEAYA